MRRRIYCKRAALKRRLSGAGSERGVALIMVLAALTVLTVMLTEFQDETSADLASALNERDSLKAEYAARSGINLARLLIAAEPTIRKPLAAIMLMMGGGKSVAQIPIWEHAPALLGAFNDEVGLARFRGLTNVNMEDAKGVGMEGAGFDIEIVDEDSKINLNLAGRPTAITKNRVAESLAGLMLGPQYDALFDERDAEGQRSSRKDICAALIDWADDDQDAYPCDREAIAQNTASAAPEDNFYQMLKDPYPRKNAPYDSLEELHLVRGVGDDFWNTFVDPNPNDPGERTLTVWGQGAINVNTANAQTLVAIACGAAVDQSAGLCGNLEQQLSLIGVLQMVRMMLPGIPLFHSKKNFIGTVQGRNPMLQPIMAGAGIEPIRLISESEFEKLITVESKVFSLVSTGYVKAGTRETRVKIHAVVDFRAAPKPFDPKSLSPEQKALVDATLRMAAPPGTQNLPTGFDEEQGINVFSPSSAGRIIYYRVN